MKVLQGNFTGRGLKIGIVAARFNEFITSKLIAGAEDALVRHEVSGDDIDLAWVPGAFEIPLVAKKMAESGKYDAIITLGAVIKGATPHWIRKMYLQLDIWKKQKASPCLRSVALRSELQIPLPVKLIIT